MAISLASISKTKHSTPPRIVVHGGEKTGKSTFFAGGTVNTSSGQVTLDSAPNPIFIQTEDGLKGVDTNAFPLANAYQEVVDALSVLVQEQHDFKTVVIDSADWLERLIHQAVIESCNLDVRGIKTMETAHGGYGKAYSVALSYWKQILQGLDYLNTNKGMIVGVICHSVVVPFNDPMAEPYDRFEMKLHQPKKGTGARDLLCEWADILGFAQNKTMVRRTKTAEGKEISRGSTIRGQLNQLHLIGNAAYVAGNRYNLPETIDLSWVALNNALSVTQPQQQAKPATTEQ